MAGKYVQDMTNGKEISLLVRFSIPMLIGNIFQQFYNMVDSIVVGNYVGSNALAAVGATGSINFLFFSLCMGMSVGIGILISQYFGAGDDEYVKRTIANTIYVTAVTGIIMSILGVMLARPFLTLLRTPAAIMDDAVAYMQIACAGIIAVAAYNAISAVLRALGDSKTPLIFLVVASVINVALDLLFVIKFGMGVRGVAYATIIAQVIAAAGSIIFAKIKIPFFTIEKQYFVYDPEIVKRCIALGVPIAAQTALISISCIILQAVVNGFGESIVAAYTATSRIEQLVQQPFNSIGAAISTFTGQNIGANKMERVKQGYRKSTLLVLIFSIVMMILAWSFGYYIMRLFVDDQAVIDLGVKALRITSTMYFPLGMIYTTRGLLNGSGDAFYAMINGFVELAGRVIFPICLVTIPMIGVWGIWYSTGFTWIITAIASIIRYRQGKWKSKSIVTSL